MTTAIDTWIFRGLGRCEMCKQPIETPADARIYLNKRKAVRGLQAIAKVDAAQQVKCGDGLLVWSADELIKREHLREQWHIAHKRCKRNSSSLVTIDGKYFPDVGRILAFTLVMRNRYYFDWTAWEHLLRNTWHIPIDGMNWDD